MKGIIKVWITKVVAIFLLIVAILILLVLNPVLGYAKKTAHKGFTIYHDQPIVVEFIDRLDAAILLIRQSELYDSDIQLDLCLNDGSYYPSLIRMLQGPAFARGFYDKVVLQGQADYVRNTLTVNGYNWNLTQLLAHEMVHCLQFNRKGFWHSKPVANIPDWKWEGYAEYVSRQGPDQQDLAANMSRYIAADPETWAISFADGTIAPRLYYRSWMLVQFCTVVKKMDFEQLLADTASEDAVWKELYDWYSSNKTESKSFVDMMDPDIIKVFRLLPDSLVFGLNAGDRDSLLAGKTFYPADNDSETIAAVNYGISPYVNEYLYLSYSFETGQRATSLVEIRSFKIGKRNLYLVSQSAGVTDINYEQQSLHAFMFNTRGIVVPYTRKLLPKLDIEPFIRPGAPEKIRKTIRDNANLAYDFSHKQVFLELGSSYLTSNPEFRKWLAGDKIRYTWTGNIFMPGTVYFSK